MPDSKITYYDIETYPNYLLFVFKLQDGTIQKFEFKGESTRVKLGKMNDLIKSHILLGWNNHQFDNIILAGILKAQAAKTYLTVNQVFTDYCKKIIEGEYKDLSQYDLQEKYGIKTICKNLKSIDLAATIGKDAGENQTTKSKAKKESVGKFFKFIPISLKLAALRIHCQKFQALPYVGQNLTQEQINEVITYCNNDVDNLEFIFKSYEEMIRVRQFLANRNGINFLSIASKDDAKLSEEFFKNVYAKRIQKQAWNLKRETKIPSQIALKDALFFEHLESDQVNKYLQYIREQILSKDNGFKPESKEFEVGNIKFNSGVGGLHSKDTAGCFETDQDYIQYQCDATSFYPTIIVNHQICPSHCDKALIEIFKETRDERIKQKKLYKETKQEEFLIASNSLKTVILAFFGKSGNEYSFFYDPLNMYKVTLNGQIMMLVLIERLHEAGIETISVNTDGIFCRMKKTEISKFNEIKEAWEKEFKITLETDVCNRYIRRDVNNYAFWVNGKLEKAVGIFATKPDIKKNYNAKIRGKAIIDYLEKGGNRKAVDIAKIRAFIESDTNPFDFFWLCRGNFLIYGTKSIEQKIVRFYCSNSGQHLRTKKNNSASSLSQEVCQNVLICDNVEDFDFAKLNREIYIQETVAILQEIFTGENTKHGKKRGSKAEKPQATFDFESDEPEPTPTQNKPKELPVTFKYPPKTRLKKAVTYFQKLGIATIAEFYNDNLDAQACFAGFPTMEKEKTWAKSLEKIEQSVCNLGIRPDDKVVVLDVDTPEKAAAMFGGITLPKTVLNHHVDNSENIYQLKAKGHLIYKKPAWLSQDELWLKHNQKLSIANQDLAEGEKGTVIELIGGGHKVTVSPSTHKSGVPYKLENAKLLENDLASLPELPRELWDKFKAIYESQNPPRPPKKTKPLSTKEDRLKEAIKEQVTIYDVLALGDKDGNKVEIRKEGRWDYIKCLWHEEESASCHINPPDSSFPPCYCYGCGKSNDQIAAFMALKQVDFKTALKHLHKIAKAKLKDQIDRENRVSQVATASNEEIIEIIANGTSEEIKRVLIGLREKQIILLEGATGSGKTRAMLEVMIEKAKQGQKCGLLCATIENANTAFARLKKLMKEQGVSFTSDLVTSDHKSEVAEDDEDEELRKANYTKYYHKVNGQYQIKEYPAQIIITTLGYAGRKGHTASSFLVYHAMIENRFVFVDEADVFFDNAMLVNLPLLARYLLEGNEYNKVNKCPVSSRKGGCGKCILAARLKSPNKITNERNFSTDFAKESEEIHIKRNDLGIASWESLLDMQSYVEINGTLYYKPIKPQDDIFDKPLELNEDGSYIGFLKHLTDNLHNPHVRIEYPKRKKEETPISPDEIVDMDNEQKKQIQFPIMACEIPTLCGVDLLALKQLFGATITKTIGKGQSEHEIEIKCAGAKAIVFATATTQTMGEFYSILEQISKAKDWKTSKAKITDIAFTFDVTLLKTMQHISIDKVDTLAQEIEKKSEVKMILVGARKKEAYDLTRTLQKKIPDKVMHYFDRAYERQFGRLGRNTLNDKAKIIVLYPKCPSLRGEDFPEVDLMIVDCQQFIPASAIAEIKPAMSNEEKRQKLIEDITRTLEQIIGRLFRSLLERKHSQTVKDYRKIVFVFHGLPTELLGFTVPSEVIHSQREVIGTFISPNAKELVSSCSEAILDALAGKPVKNYHDIAKAKAVEKAATEGRDGLSKKERLLLGEDTKEDVKAKKQEAKLIELSQTVMDMAQKGIDWRKISRELNLNRHKAFQEKLKQVYEDNFNTNAVDPIQFYEI